MGIGRVGMKKGKFMKEVDPYCTEINCKFVLQYVFLMDIQGKLLTCDESAEEFLRNINFGLFYAQIQSLKINTAITNTTIILDSKSYNLRMVPTVLQSKLKPQIPHIHSSNPDETEYIIVLQDQHLLSYIYQKINQLKLEFKTSSNREQYEYGELASLLDSSSSGIFITNSHAVVMYANLAYETATGLDRSSFIGKRISDLGASGLLEPIITPTILETHDSLTTLQKLGSEKYAVISGSPIYDSNGEPMLIITCVNVINFLHEADYPEQYYDASMIDFQINMRKKDYSIDIIAESPAMKSLLQEAIKVARYNVTVLLLGETGVGKEVISSIIHASSSRNMEKFVKINCSAIAPNLLESELFGYEAGAFTGALSKGKPGLFEVANKGTILLDEIGDMPIELQAKLLRVIQGREFYRIGGLEPLKCDVRVIASTNKDLEKLIEKGEFRQDLYYRLNVISIHIPSLRERKEDIKPLLLHFSYYYNKKYSTNKQFSNELVQILQEYHWPGNIRELQNVVERLILLCLEDVLQPEHLHSKYKLSGVAAASENDIQINRIMPMQEAISTVEKLLVTKAMSICKSTRKAADLLGVSQSTVMRKLRDNGIVWQEEK